MFTLLALIERGTETLFTCFRKKTLPSLHVSSRFVPSARPSRSKDGTVLRRLPSLPGLNGQLTQPIQILIKLRVPIGSIPQLQMVSSADQGDLFARSRSPEDFVRDQ